MTDTTTDMDALRLQYARLTRAVVHELRIPLQSLQGFTELIEPGIAPTRLKRFLSLMRRDALRLGAVVDDLSLQSELDLGLVQLEAKPCAVEPLLLELAQALEMRFPEQVVAVECPDPTSPALADEERLRQLLWRLLTNAARHAAGRAPVIGLTAQATGANIEFHVRAAGPRLPVESPEQLGASIADKAATRGRMDLGLYALRELARHMGGELWIETPDVVTEASGHARCRPLGNVFVLSLPSASRES